LFFQRGSHFSPRADLTLGHDLPTYASQVAVSAGIHTWLIC
jgi:hypothetical protein